MKYLLLFYLQVLLNLWFQCSWVRFLSSPSIFGSPSSLRARRQIPMLHISILLRAAIYFAHQIAKQENAILYRLTLIEKSLEPEASRLPFKCRHRTAFERPLSVMVPTPCTAELYVPNTNSIVITTGHNTLAIELNTPYT